MLPALAAQLPTTLLQLSDLHFATTDFEKPSVFGDRIGDADLFAAALLPGLAPDAVLITGDLTEGKLATGGGRSSRASGAPTASSSPPCARPWRQSRPW